jgi:hypothetical protein
MTVLTICTYNEPTSEHISWFFNEDSKIIKTYPEEQRKQLGFLQERSIKEIIKLLQGIKNVRTSTTGSSLDVNYGVDIYWKYEDSDIAYGIQVKSYYTKVNEYMCKDAYKEGKLCKGILYTDIMCDKTEILYKLSEWLNQPIKEEVLEIIELSNKLKNMELPIKTFKFNSFQYNTLKVLNLAQVKGSNIIFKEKTYSN